MDPITRDLFVVGVPTLTVLVGILINNVRMNDLRANINDLRAHVDQRFASVDQRLSDQAEIFKAQLLRVEQVLDARLSHLEDRK